MSDKVPCQKVFCSYVDECFEAARIPYITYVTVTKQRKCLWNIDYRAFPIKQASRFLMWGVCSSLYRGCLPPGTVG